MIKHRYFVGRVLVYGLISVTVMLSAAVTGCNNKNNISEGSIKTEAVQPEGNNQSEEGSESDVNDLPSDIDVEPPVIHGKIGRATSELQSQWSSRMPSSA